MKTCLSILAFTIFFCHTLCASGIVLSDVGKKAAQAQLQSNTVLLDFNYHGEDTCCGGINAFWPSGGGSYTVLRNYLYSLTLTYMSQQESNVRPLPIISLWRPSKDNCCPDQPNMLFFISPDEVEMLQFDVDCKGNDYEISWQTEIKIENSIFNVMRSEDLDNWEVIGSISGVGNSSSGLKYRFLDEAPLNGLAFYQLEQVDSKGETSSSEAIAVGECVASDN